LGREVEVLVNPIPASLWPRKALLRSFPGIKFVEMRNRTIVKTRFFNKTVLLRTTGTSHFT
jgi:hypothetical protein